MAGYQFVGVAAPSEHPPPLMCKYIVVVYSCSVGARFSPFSCAAHHSHLFLQNSVYLSLCVQ